MKFIGRQNEINRINSFIKKKKSDILFVKGRRRVGKSSILEQVSKKNKNIVSYLGTQRKLEKDLFNFLKKIEENYNLIEVSNSVVNSMTQEISPDVFFNRLLEIIKKRKTTTILFVDEIQWMGYDGGHLFSIKLKEFWIQLEQTNKFKIVITGSSYKYFDEYVSNQNAFLRSISGEAFLEVKPFTPSELKKHFFKNFKHHEVLLIYMMTGGVSQYLNWLKDIDGGFLKCVNSSFFIKDNPFLDEVKELLKIDIDGKESSAIEILRVIKNNDYEISSILRDVNKKIEISESTVRRFVYDMLKVGFLGKKNKEGQIIDSSSEDNNCSYYIKDLFLFFYFTVINDLIDDIKENESDNIFKKLIKSKKEIPVIDGFTGKGFELVVIDILSQKNLNLPIFEKLRLDHKKFKVNTYTIKGKEQIDLYIEDNSFDIIKAIECKWIGSLTKTHKNYCDEIKDKRFLNDLKDKKRENYYMFSLPIDFKGKKVYENNDVVILYYKDLFE